MRTRPRRLQRKRLPRKPNRRRTQTAAADPAKAKKNGTTTYRVKKGDSLGKIAERNGTTVAEILKLNNMKLKDPLYVDRKLKIPAPAVKEEEKAAPEIITYQVKKGDTMEKIALMHHTTVRSIRTLNNLKTDDPMVAGRKLKVPVEKPDEDLPAEPVGEGTKTGRQEDPGGRAGAEACDIQGEKRRHRWKRSRPVTTQRSPSF